MMINPPLYRRCWAIFIFLLISRVLAMCLIPLNDHTEARYSEIARMMLETNNWVTPLQALGEPFWAKPPLSTWLSAISMKILGVNAFAVRLPALLFSIAILFLIWDLAKKQSGEVVAMMSTLILASALFFYLDAGTVMTDPALIFCTTLCFVAFWQAVVMQQKQWGYWFFVGLGLGLLAKGPVATVLTGMPIFFWVLRHKHRWSALYYRLPWFKGLLLSLLIALPWYILAEIRTPGFLNYFIMGEHIHRFLDPGWTGDKYGFAHSSPIGMIWLYFFAGMLPWSVSGFIGLCRHVKDIPFLFKDSDGFLSYLSVFTLVPLVFFTGSKNIIYTYVFPMIPSCAMLFAELIHRVHHDRSISSRFFVLSSLSGVIFLIVTALFIFKPQWVEKSQYRVIRLIQETSLISNQVDRNRSCPSRVGGNPFFYLHRCQYNDGSPPTRGGQDDTKGEQYDNQDSQPSQVGIIYWLPALDYSAKFYSKGHAVALVKLDELCQVIKLHNDNYLVVKSGYSPFIPNEITSMLSQIGLVTVSNNKFIIFRLQGVHCE